VTTKNCNAVAAAKKTKGVPVPNLPARTGNSSAMSSVHEPVAGAAHALALGADRGGKDFADVDPDDRALRNAKRRRCKSTSSQSSAAWCELVMKSQGHTGRGRWCPPRQ
jgi:hypothetical protein